MTERKKIEAVAEKIADVLYREKYRSLNRKTASWARYAATIFRVLLEEFS